MGLCDELEAKLRKQREDNKKLMQAAFKDLLEGKKPKNENLIS
jgi:type I restriction enzyme S subunit